MGSMPRRIGVLVRDGYQELEFWYPVLRFREEGAEVTVIGAAGDRTYHSKLGYPVIPDVALSAAPDGLDAIVVPGASPQSEVNGAISRFLEAASARGAIVGATSEGPRALAQAGLLRGRRAASADSAAAALKAGGAAAVGETVAVDKTVVTARSADDLPAFFRALDTALAGKA